MLSNLILSSLMSAKANYASLWAKHMAGLSVQNGGNCMEIPDNSAG
jgi:hypothetical protein